MIVQLKKFKGLTLPVILFALVFLNAVFAFSQENTAISTLIPRFAPTVNPSPTPKPYIYNKEKEKSKTKNRIRNESDTPAEKSLAVDAKVNISLCVSEGNVKVNGWDRSEIRAFVSNGSQVGFKIMQRSKQTNSPVWVIAVGFDPAKNTDANADECLSGDEIELDVPRYATVNIKSRESGVTIESVGKVRVENDGGDICLKNIAWGIEARTYQGSVTVGNSSGAMSLSTTDGNIVAYEASPSEIGDVFKAKTTNGQIALDKIEHRQLDVGSISGSIKFAGEFLNGGQYNFSTSSGLILLVVPEKSSCWINASLAYGTFHSEIPLITENISNPNGIKSLTGVLGKGEAKLSLKTYNGRINIKKQ